MPHTEVRQCHELSYQRLRSNGSCHTDSHPCMDAEEYDRLSWRCRIRIGRCGKHCLWTADAAAGNHIISDTTIMASAGAECKHVHHVSSQLPYALTVAAVSFLTFVVAGFTQQLGIIACAAISWVSGIAMLFSALWVLRRISR